MRNYYWIGIIWMVTMYIDLSTVFPTFDMDKLGEIHWLRHKERL